MDEHITKSNDMKKAHRSEFLKAIKERFPEVRGDINKEGGLLSFEVAVFIKFIQRKIDSNEKTDVIEAFNLLNRFYVDGNAQLNQVIKNAICEDLELSNTEKLDRYWAFEELPSPLKSERKKWFRFMGYGSE